MKKQSLRLTAATLLIACAASVVGCYPVYPPNYNTAYNQDSKGYSGPQEAAPQPQQVRYAVDPGLVVAGVAAAGLLGYAIGNNHGYHNHYYYGGPAYYRPAPYYRYGRAYGGYHP
ncbi:MAG: hypothetical protein ABIS50_19235 [Luteolibacter sp.]|uniref:hypothetical protein n=1 Tax=Luteolibacter sp. TaxID=1962973 RepID=UPI0032632564